ncbi:MAG TPA: TolC family protein [Polyangiales bacterium]|nr:TolC family protein [Polyangiales bacterium]
MNRLTMMTAAVPWMMIGAQWSGCAHGQHDRYEELQSALREEEHSSVKATQTEEPVVFPSDGPLHREALVHAVLARNPNLEASRQAWRAALAQHPQARSLEDTRASYSLAPLSIRSDEVRFGQVVRLEQRFPTPGKLRFAGQVALAEAEAEQANYEAVRLTLALMASSLFDEYYRLTRLLELNEEHRQLIEDIRASAMVQYEAGRVSQQDPLQAEVELAHIIHQRVVLRSQRDVVVAQINGLLHQRPDLPLPAPPARTQPRPTDIGPSESLQREAIESRPELRAAQAEMRAASSSVSLAKRNYSPEIGLMGEYNSMWAQTDHQWMTGVSLNLPLQIRARKGAVDEAEARAQQAAAELTAMRDDVRVEVDQARQRMLEARHVVRLYQERLIPAARAQIDAAEFGYETGRNSFQALIDAERSLRTLEIQYEDSLADLGQRAAELDRARGIVPGISAEGGHDERP